MLEKHRHLLIRNRPAIVQDLLVEDVLTELRSKFIIDQEDSELVESERTSQRKAEKLLDLLPNKGYNAFNAFYESLLDKNEHLAKLLASGLSDNDDGTNSGVHSLNNNLGDEAGPMTEAHRELLTSNRVAIVEDLLVDDVLAQLFSNFVFDDSDKELIRSEPTSKRQAEKLLDLLVRKGDEAFGHFLSALKDSYPHLAELLQVYDKGLPEKSRFPSVTDDVEEIVKSKLLKGDVPNQPQVFIARPHERDKLRTALRSLKNRDAWVVLHGMAGSGKTVLAADALRSASLLDETFPGGVVWVQIGPVDRQKLLMKMQNLCKRLDEDKHRPEPRNLEEARERLQNLFTVQHPLKLLVLDDLWSAHDARFFDIRARVLVTTRDVSIAECIEVTRCPVSVAEKLSSSQCRYILAKWIGTKETDLPREADDIITECNGHPLVISIFGALLRDHPRRWLYYWTQFHNHKLGKFTPKFAYGYPGLNEAIAMSIYNLDENLRDKFFDFVIFDSSIKVPLSVFCLLWDMEDEMEVEDILGELVKKSLVKTTECPGSPYGRISYAIHNLQLTYMLENCNDIVDRHKRLVESYKKACNKGDFSSLTDDGYVYWNLVHHMLKANQQGKAIQLLTNLAWVTRKLEVSGPADIINDYIKVYKLVEEEERDEFKDLSDFHHFVRTNAHMFASRPIPDVVQTALSEPAGNEVYKQAKEEALKRSKDGKLYVDWCNKESESVQSLEMTVKPHDGPIHCCVFSSDGKHILSSSSDKTAKVWEAISGRVLHTLEGHDDAVICCAFNHDNTKVLTTSHDKTVKVWKLGADHGLQLTYKDHKQDVHCAAFSPALSEKKIVSCSADCTIKVWNSETGETSVTLTHEGHSAVVRWCCFSSDGLKIASGSHDETVKVWETASGKCLVTTEKHGSFVSYCCFSPDNTLLYSCAKTLIRIWDSATGQSHDFIDIEVDVLAFRLSPAGDKLAVALWDATVQVWDIATKTQPQPSYNGHKSWVHTVDFSPDGAQLVSGSADETIKVWPVDTADFVKRVKLKKVFDVFFKETQPLIAVADNKDRIKFFEGLQGNESHCSEAYNAKITCVLFSLDGDKVAIGLISGQIKILSVPTCQPVLSLDGHEGRVYSLNYSTSGALLLSCSKDKTFMLWDTVSGKPLFDKEPRHEDEVTVASFFDDDKRIVTASKDGTAKVWDSTSGKLLYTCDHEQGQWVSTCVVSPDNKNIVTGSANAVVKGWESSTGQELFKISPHSDVVRSLAINEDNSVFASGSDDGSVQILSLKTGSVSSSCTSHKGAWVADMGFAKDCKQLVTVGNNIKWHSVGGKLLQQFFVKGSHLRRIKYSPDFQLFITVDNIGVLYILKVIT